jgi:hypothetical protein
MIHEALRMIRKTTIQKPDIKEFNFSFQIEHYTLNQPELMTTKFCVYNEDVTDFQP